MNDTNNSPGLPGQNRRADRRPPAPRPPEIPIPPADAEHALYPVSGRKIALTRPERGQGYTRAMQIMHWVTVALLFGAYLLAWAAGNAETGVEAAWLVMLHRSFGLTILALTAIRFAWRQRSRVPPLPADVPAIQQLAARASAMGLYVLLALQPLLGLTASMLHGDRILVFGGIVAPSFLPADPAFAHQVFEMHGWTALLLLALIGVHSGAALYHHLIRRDEVLAGMLPGLLRRSAPRPGATGG